MRRRLAIVMAMMLLLTGCGCSYTADEPLPIEKVTEIPTPTEATLPEGGEAQTTPTKAPTEFEEPTEAVTPTPAPTGSTEASATPSPTNVPTKVVTPTGAEEPTPTQRPNATITPTKVPTENAEPTKVPSPSQEPTKAPTATTAPTLTKKPTEASTPTPTKKPTEAPTPTPTKKPTPTPTKKPTPTPTKAPTATPTPAKSLSAITVNGKSLKIGDTKSTVTSVFGTPSRTDSGEGNFSHMIYNGDYKNFLMVAIDSNQKVVGFYACSKNINYYGLTSSSKLANVNAALGTSASEANDQYESTGVVQKTSGGVSCNIYMDANGNGNVYAVECMSTSVTYKKVTAMSASAISSMEKQVFDITNAYRAQYGLRALKWCDKAATAGRDYCEVMADLNLLDHSADGTKFSDRLKEAGISWGACGENIAANSVTYGHFYDMGGAVAMTASWIKSAGHRSSILNTLYAYLGVGIVGDASPKPWEDYGAQEFYK